MLYVIFEKLLMISFRFFNVSYLVIQFICGSLEIKPTSAIIPADRGTSGHFRTFVASVVAIILAVAPETEIHARH